jgi:hypothetical protein
MAAAAMATCAIQPSRNSYLASLPPVSAGLSPARNTRLIGDVLACDMHPLTHQVAQRLRRYACLRA